MSPTPTNCPSRVLIVDHDSERRQALALCLREVGHEAVTASSTAQGLAELERNDFACLCCCLAEETIDGFALLEESLRQIYPPSVIMLMPSDKFDRGLEAIKRGVDDIVAYPAPATEVMFTLEKTLRRRPRQRFMRPANASLASPFEELTAASDAMRAVLHTLTKVADYRATVLISGESGTGKELAARFLHQHSPRREGPFVPVNCCAIPETLIESELFGYRKGAFTGALRDKPGLFEQACGGTLFLDEIGDLPLSIQVKLLRVLQAEEFTPVGASESIRADVRVVATTARQLDAEVAAGRFREDLFYRLNVLPVFIPPLRERREEIPSLVEKFVARANVRMGTQITGFAPEAMDLLMHYPWPGNVRELENTVERACALSDRSLVEAAMLSDKTRLPTVAIPSILQDNEGSIKKAARITEEKLIRQALEKTAGNRTKASKLLEISHRSLLYKIKRYGIRNI